MATDGDGRMVGAVAVAVEAARRAGLDAVGEARAQLATELARVLDGGTEQPAAVARELRLTLAELPVPSDEGSTVDDLARRRAARRSDAAVQQPAAGGDVGGK